MIKPTTSNSFTPELLYWYHHESYDFPWRNTNNPYFIWISEVMLQQTRVATVLPFYERWITVMPNIKAVADAHIDTLLKLWEGLGYYNRVRNFQKACILIIEKHKGLVPGNYDDFSALPGVGSYISSAVMSIAFRLRHPAVDGNAIRVASRMNCIKKHYPKSITQTNAFLNKHIDPDNPGEFNQAIMDLGREICTLRNPSCLSCPVQKYCSSYVNNTVDKYPLTKNSLPKPVYHVAVGIIWKKDQILISKRKDSGLLAGLWEFPGGKVKQGENGTTCVVREALEELNVRIISETHIKQIKHTYSHFSIILDAYRCIYVGGAPRAIDCADFRWIYPSEIWRFAFPSASHKLFDKIDGASSS